jgi:hypothetical protein
MDWAEWAQRMVVPATLCMPAAMALQVPLMLPAVVAAAPEQTALEFPRHQIQALRHLPAAATAGPVRQPLKGVAATVFLLAVVAAAV